VQMRPVARALAHLHETASLCKEGIKLEINPYTRPLKLAVLWELSPFAEPRNARRVAWCTARSRSAARALQGYAT